ncbi:MAG: hypothetical protein WCK89_14180 [bacterium]
MNKPICCTNWGLGVLIAGALVLAWANRFVQDDAFISFQYARNLAEGHGLVWNVGERVEGYTNFLWTVCLTPAWLWGFDPAGFAYALSLAATGVTLLMSYRLTLALGARREAGLLCVFLLATNYSFSCYGTGGLETQFVTAWVLTAAWLLMRPYGDRRSLWTMVAAGVASACAVMTRMDAVILLGPFWAWQAVGAWRQKAGRQWWALITGGLAATVPIVLWLVWRHSYYGAWVPNTFFIKSAGVSWLRGTYYVGLFYLVYGFWLVVPACMRGLPRLVVTPVAVCAGAGWLLWNVYVVVIGGDFMEFRMMIPALPLAFACVAGGVVHGCRTQLGRVLLVVALVMCSGFHGKMQIVYPGIQSIRELKAYFVEWQEVAGMLSRHLGEGRKAVKIAVTAAGIIPYDTRCPTLDLLGLNDRGIARSGERVESVNRWLGNRPGHVRIADRETVRARGVNLLLNKPWVTDANGWAGRSARDICETWSLGVGSDRMRVHAVRVRYVVRPDEVAPCVVAWPLGDGRYLMSVYVCPSPIIETAILRCHAQVIGERR